MAGAGQTDAGCDYTKSSKVFQMGIEPEIAVTADAAQASLGQQLQAGRERLGMSVSDTSARLKLSENIIRRMEADELAGLTEGVFLRGYLISYARLVGLPSTAIDAAIRQHTQPVPLVATGTIPRSRYLLDRWSVSATYLILTGLIIGPTVWLATTHGGIEHSLVRTTPLDRSVESPVAARPDIVGATDAVASVNGAQSFDSAATQVPTAVVPAEAEAAPPVTASLAPFATMTNPVASSVTEATASHEVQLTISEPSWVEVLKADGTRLEYGLLPVGVQRSYKSDTPLTIRIGNVAGTQMHVDGQVVELAALKRGNVAYLRLFGDAATVARVEP